jgi:hypothetical protein
VTPSPAGGCLRTNPDPNHADTNRGTAAALRVREYIQILYREYLGSDLSQPMADRVRAARCADGRRLADRHGDGPQPAEQAVSADQQELRLHSVPVLTS